MGGSYHAVVTIKGNMVIRLSGFLLMNPRNVYRDPDNRGLGFFFRLSGTFSGPSHHPIIEDLLYNDYKILFKFAHRCAYKYRLKIESLLGFRLLG